jgi:hypothetical protein
MLLLELYDPSKFDNLGFFTSSVPAEAVPAVSSASPVTPATPGTIATPGAVATPGPTLV